jgi:two-component system, chemotaxis family, chemotaxis protein CheY
MKTCLVVDDSEVVRKVARYIFEHLQFEAREAETGQEGLDSCAQEMPDTILLDSHIPPMPTAAFLSALRAMPNGDKPVVIYCATENDSTDIARALTAGADDYVMKPFDRESLGPKLTATRAT